MRHLIRLVESLIREGVPLYHGTPKKVDAENIMRDGLKPPALAKNAYNLQPQAGYVYLTPHLDYAFNYAMGSHFELASRARMKIPFDGNEKKFQWLRAKDGSWDGYVFVVHPQAITTDLHPDEDAVGVLYDAAISKGIHFYLESFLPQKVLDAARTTPEMLARFVTHVESSVPDSTRKKLRTSERSDRMIGWAAKVGKMALRKMDPSLKEWLVQIGCHVGHKGIVMPDECWRFDKRKIGFLDPDCGNFFDLAERIN